MTWLSCLGSAIGNLVALEDAEGIDHASAQRLYEAGQRTISVAASVDVLLRQTIERTLGEADVNSISRVLVVSESALLAATLHEHQRRRAALYSLLAEAGLSRAPVRVLSHGGCASFLTAAELCGLAAEQEDSAILLIAVEVVPPHSPRVLPPAVTAIGDGAASCLITASEPDFGWQIGPFAHQGFLETIRPDGASDDFGPALISLARALMTLTSNWRIEGRIHDDMALVCSNYPRSTIQMIGHVTGFKTEALFMKNVERYAHIGCPDLLINLADLDGPERDVLLVGNGPGDCCIANARLVGRRGQPDVRIRRSHAAEVGSATAH